MQQYFSYLGEGLGDILQIHLKNISKERKWEGSWGKVPTAIDLFPDRYHQEGDHPYQQGNCDAKNSHGASGLQL